MVATAVRAIKRVNKINRVDVLPLADGGSATEAAGSWTPVGTAGENGTFEIIVGSQFHNKYEITVAKDDTATAIVDKAVALITADSKSLVTAVNNTAVLELTAVNAGREGNFITIKVLGQVDSITYTVVGMTGGAGDPDGISDGTALNAIDADTRYQAVIWPQTYNATVSPAADDYEHIRAFMTTRFETSNPLLDGMIFIGRTDTLANFNDLGTLLDDKVVTIEANKPVSDTAFYVGSALVEMDYVQAAYFAAIRALRLTTDTQIGQYIVGSEGALDDIGGIALASLPYFNTPFTNLIPVTDKKYFWKTTEVNELLSNGVSVFGNNVANNSVIAGQMVTTYLTNEASDPDPTYKYLNYFDTFTNIREYFVNNLRSRFRQSRLVEGDVRPLRNEANPPLIQAILLDIYRDLEIQTLVEDGRTAEKEFKDSIVITLEPSSGRADVIMVISPVVQLREINIVFEIKFSL